MDPSSLFFGFLTVFGKAAGTRVGAETANALRELIGLQQAQTELLNRMDVKLDVLTGRPYEAGCRELAYALDHWRQPAEREEFTKLARMRFTEAQSHPSPLARSLAALHLAVVWAMLDSPRDVRASLNEAQLEALRAVELEPQHGKTGLSKLWARDSGLLRPSQPSMAVGPAQPKQRELISLANFIAMARREWGEPASSAPVFVGFSFKKAEGNPRLTPMEQVRWSLLNMGGWPVSVDYSGIPEVSRRSASDEVVAWIDHMERTGNLLFYPYISRWLTEH